MFESTDFNIGDKPRNSHIPPSGLPAPGGPGHWGAKPRNSIIPPGGKPAPGVVDKKPANTPVPPAGKPSPGGNLVVQPASFTILNNMVAGVSVHCHDQTQDIPSAIISPGAPAFTVNFQADTANDLPWLCEFKNVANTGSQSIIVWTHDGKSTPYLSECENCHWKVQSDGFWLWSERQSVYVNVDAWNY
jgi:hypothetical protein